MPKLAAARHRRKLFPHALQWKHLRVLGGQVPKNVRWTFFATTVCWFGWGFGELLLPIFLFSFGESYAEAGLLSATWDIAFLLALPAAGMLADRISGVNLIIIGAFLYIFIGLGYFLAGVTGLVLFIVLARLLNGVSYAFNSVGRETYARHHVPTEKVAGTFGYFDTISNFWWIAAGILGLFMVRLGVPIHWLLLLITPASLISFFMALRLRHRKASQIEGSITRSISRKAFLETFRELNRWGWKLQLLAATNLFVAAVGTIAGFFIPIMVFEQSRDPASAVIAGILYVIPMIFGVTFGKIADKKREVGIMSGLFTLSIILMFGAWNGSFAAQLLLSFSIGLLVEFLNLASSGLVTATVPPGHFGRISSVMSTVSDLGALFGPVLMGVLMDTAGRPTMFYAVAAVSIVLGITFYSNRSLYSPLPQLE